jgi:hypothetical protein
MNDTFVCSVCGQTHAGLQTDEAYGLPDDVWAIPQEERASRAKFDSDLCQYGERLFIRCLLPVPFAETDGYFGWGVWVEVEQIVFRRYLDLFEADGSDEPRHVGRLANSLSVYPGMSGAKVLIQFWGQQGPPFSAFSTRRFFPACDRAKARHRLRSVSRDTGRSCHAPLTFSLSKSVSSFPRRRAGGRTRPAVSQVQTSRANRGRD